MMDYLKRFDFNQKTGWISIILFSLGLSLLVFAAVYMIEGVSWLTAENERNLDVYGETGWNWVRGSGIAFLISLGLLATSYALLKRNKKSKMPAPPLRGKLDLNRPKATLGLVFLSVSLVFFFNAILYRNEAASWIYAAVELTRPWYLEEASGWVAAASTVNAIGAVLAASGLVLLLLAWNKTKTS